MFAHKVDLKNSNWESGMWEGRASSLSKECESLLHNIQLHNLEHIKIIIIQLGVSKHNFSIISSYKTLSV